MEQSNNMKPRGNGGPKKMCIRDRFYDMLKLNSEAREYDFKKNLEAKTKLCEASLFNLSMS